MPTLTIGTKRTLLLGNTPRIPPGMVAAWTLDNATSGYVDLVGGRAVTEVGTGTTFASGVIANAVALNGSGNLSAGTHANYQAEVGFAIEMWAYFTIASGLEFVAFKGTSTGVFDWDLFHNGSNYGWRVNSVNAAWNVVKPLATWTHIVGTVDVGLVSRLYVNGVERATATVTLNAGRDTMPLEFGARLSAARLTGRIDEPRIWQFGAAGDPGAAFWTDRYNSGLGKRP